jgi:Cu-Zn family superoxide dismutase
MKKLLPLCFAALLPLAGCASSKPAPMAMAMLSPTTNQTATGMVHFTQNNDGSVDVKVDLTGVPAGVHGFHVHEGNSCADDAKAAGGHFNPNQMQHAAPDAQSHHAGDFGNDTADANGEVHTSFTTRSITVTAGASSVVGHAVVLHANADDLTSQPAGNAGARIACGVTEAMGADMAGMHH